MKHFPFTRTKYPTLATFWRRGLLCITVSEGQSLTGWLPGRNSMAEEPGGRNLVAKQRDRRSQGQEYTHPGHIPSDLSLLIRLKLLNPPPGPPPMSMAPSVIQSLSKSSTFVCTTLLGNILHLSLNTQGRPGGATSGIGEDS